MISDWGLFSSSFGCCFFWFLYWVFNAKKLQLGSLTFCSCLHIKLFFVMIVVVITFGVLINLTEKGRIGFFPKKEEGRIGWISNSSNFHFRSWTLISFVVFFLFCVPRRQDECVVVFFLYWNFQSIGLLMVVCFEGLSSSYWLLEVGVFNLQSAKYGLRFCFSFPF